MLLNQSSLLLTGSTGFVGSRLCEVATEDGWSVRQAVRRIYGMQDEVVVSDLSDKTDWAEALINIDIVIHLAARVHIMDDSVADPLAEFRKVNTAGTLNLARQAAGAGVKRFIFLSSIKVNGEMTSVDQRFKPSDKYIPTDLYGLSKYEAEQGLLAIAKETLQRKMQFLKSLYDVKARLNLGTDTQQPFVVPGVSYLSEIKLFHDSGLPMEDILAYATWRAAEQFPGANFGKVAQGYQADFLIFKEDPTQSIEALDTLQAVVIRGKLYDKTELDNAIEKMKQHYNSWPLKPISFFFAERAMQKIVKNFTH